MSRPGARTLLRGGVVHTPADPHATAMCIQDGVVVWTGDDAAAANFVDNAEVVLELAGRLVTPAFVDAHAHLAQTGLAATGPKLDQAGSLGEALDLLTAYCRQDRSPVVLGMGWDESRWPERRPFTRVEVDRATEGRSVYLARVDEHSAVVSTAFLDACPAVPHAEGYAASGLVAREAHHLARKALFTMLSPSVREGAILRALREAARQGIGMVHELGAPHICPPEDLVVARRLAVRDVLPEVVGYWGELGAVELARELGCTGAAGDLCLDGSVGSRTCALQAPYADDPTSGNLYLDAEQVRDHVVACTRAGLQAGFHVIGDRSAATALAGLRRAADQVGSSAMVAARHRLEHLEMVSPDEMAGLGELGVTASMQPMFDQLWGGDASLYAQRLGIERAASMNAFASLNRAGVALAFGSDSPVTPLGPWAAVRAAAWHHTETERITVRAAFTAHTRGGWRAARRDEGGVLAVGAPASIAVWEVPGDLVVQTPDERVAAWSTDPRAGVPRLPDLQQDQDLPSCVLTLVAGRVAFEEPGIW